MNVSPRVNTIEARVSLRQKTPNAAHALKLLSGMWSKKKRAPKDIERIRKQLWR
ncbi:MAG: hypothetical protein AAB400_00280 [Patescibacteria group bacterium]